MKKLIVSILITLVLALFPVAISAPGFPSIRDAKFDRCHAPLISLNDGCKYPTEYEKCIEKWGNDNFHKAFCDPRFIRPRYDPSVVKEL